MPPFQHTSLCFAVSNGFLWNFLSVLIQLSSWSEVIGSREILSRSLPLQNDHLCQSCEMLACGIDLPCGEYKKNMLNWLDIVITRRLQYDYKVNKAAWIPDQVRAFDKLML